MLAYLTLAYDLYVLKHHQLLQGKLIKRLKDHNNFHGARYELLVAATFIRAGFDIDFEDERDGRSKHPEFVATHKASGHKFDVEAKKRNRKTKLNKEDFDSSGAKISIGSLLSNAFLKFRRRPFIVCIDMDIPPYAGNPFQQNWSREILESPDKSGGRNREGKDCFNVIFFTNHPVDYTLEEPSSFNYLLMISQVPDIEIKSYDPIWALDKAFAQCGKIPSKFDE